MHSKATSSLAQKLIKIHLVLEQNCKLKFAIIRLMSVTHTNSVRFQYVIGFQT